jgi:hypothetical protein
MKTLKTAWAALLVGAACSTVYTPKAGAQTSEALMDALVRKGILTEQEAEDIKADVAKENRQYNKITVAGKTVSGLNLYGDFRGRYEYFSSENDAYVTRNRFRYRLRAGLTYTMFDQFEAGFRLSSSEASGSFGGDPISGNTTFSDNGSKKFLYLDQAYGRWYALKTPEWTTALTIGKMDNPFVFSDLVFDGDYTPEGASVQFGHTFNDQHTVRFNGGAFVLDELSAAASDPYLFGAQVRWDAKWSPKVASSAGVAGLALQNPEYLPNGNVPNVNRGNTRNAAGAPQYNFNPIVTDLALTYTVDRVPLYPGAFPIKVGGDYMVNPATPSSVDNYGYSAGITFGKAGKKGTWEVGYTYKWLGSDAWWEELVDSDFGAFYQNTVGANDGFVTASNPTGAGYSAGTNVKGHIARISYSPYDSILLTGKVLFTDLINPFPAGSESSMVRLQMDANWKF